MTTHHTSIDIETFSDVDIKKAGLYKYAQSPAFDILLIAWAVDNGPVRIVDLTVDLGAEGAGREWQALQDFYHDLYAPDTVLHAYNAAFEHFCINTWLERQGRAPIPLSRWRCTMAHASYCGYPGSLAMVGEAIGLPEDQQKMAVGKALIRKFCVPQKPNKAHPEPWRVRPADEPEKWELFKTYCRQDVATEREIERRLARWPMPGREQQLWELTTESNLTGVGVDLALVDGAIEVGETEQQELLAEAREISGLDNPKSTQQLMAWLNKEMDEEVTDLRKTTVAELLDVLRDSPERPTKGRAEGPDTGCPCTETRWQAEGDARGAVARMLEIRQLISKTSTKKYDALKASACSDARVRGMMAYYGASRTGRWAGRIVQPQNLPQNHLNGLGEARELVKARDLEMLRLCWGSIPDTLSQLIRTAFIPAPGKLYAVADYSAIEARVIAWLAGENWVLEAFRRGEDIYCATASQMFGVPVQKHGENSELRQKGKVAVLACVAKGEPVLTDHGLKPIETVTTTDRLWDGKEWVSHDGVVCNGRREVIHYDGLTATPDHLVWVEGEPGPVQFGLAAARGARLKRSGDREQALRVGEDNQPGETLEQGEEPLLRSGRVPGLRRNPVDTLGEPARREVEGMPILLTATTDSDLAGKALDRGEAAVHKSERRGVSALRRPGHPIPFQERDGRGSIHDTDTRLAGQGDGDRPDRHQRRLCTGEPALGDAQAELCEPENHGAQQVRPELLALCGDNHPAKAGRGLDPRGDHPGRGDRGVRTPEKLEGYCGEVEVYDIRNAGRRHRFTVSNVLVHNCGYGGGIGAIKAMGGERLGLNETEMQSVINKWRAANKRICQLWSKAENAALAAVQNGGPTVIPIWGTGQRVVFRMEAEGAQKFLTVELPAGRKLFYAQPFIAPSKKKAHEDALFYYQTNQSTRKWGATDTWGGKLVENITQAVARDCISETLLTLRAMNRNPVFHVHDEVICEVDDASELDTILDIMARPIDWAPGLPLKGAGFVCDFYQKD